MFRSSVLACVVLSIAAALPRAADAKGAFLPTFHPKPCSGDSCFADDPRSGQSCTGFLCSLTSAKAMQPPVTASQAAELEKAAAMAQAAQTVAPPAPDQFKRKHAGKAVAKAPAPKPEIAEASAK